MPEESSAEKRREFEAKARLEHWKCSRCGKAITFEDRDAYREAKRCARCHFELDTESGPVGVL